MDHLPIARPLSKTQALTTTSLPKTSYKATLKKPPHFFPTLATANSNILLAFYLEYVYFDRRDHTAAPGIAQKRAPGVYSENVQSGGRTTYGTV